MSEHISENELLQYLKIILKNGESYDNNIDFINEIDAHIAECPECFEKMQTARLITAGILSDEKLASVYKKAGIKSSVFLNIELVKDAVSNSIKALTQSVDNTLDWAFVPNAVSLAGVRGTGETVDSAPNDLLTSRIDLRLNDTRITARCEKGTDTDDIMLCIYSDKDIGFKVLCDGNKLSSFKNGYDSALKEFITIYKLNGNRITLGL